MEPKEFLNYTVSQVTGVRKTEGNKFGVELELEGRNVGLQDVAVRGWQRHNDGSLRGEAIEYTINGAKTFDETQRAVSDLFRKFKENKVTINDSIRTSTHVHLNFSDKLVKQMVNFFSLFTMLEEVLQYYSGEDRKGNLFCISSREAEGIIGVLAHSIAKGSLDRFAGDRYKYAACNLSTLYKFGTVEVRTMRGASSAEQVNNWLAILNEMYEYSLDMRSPVQLITDLSYIGAEALLRRIFSPASYDELMKAFPAPATLHYSLMEGARLIQVFAFEYDEAFTAKVEIKIPEVGVGEPLPYQIKKGLHHGSLYCVYRPDGMFWNVGRVNKFRNGGCWRHNEHCVDEERIKWDAMLGRFIYEYDNGERVALNWHRHHAIADEGRPARRDVDAPRNPRWRLPVHDEDGEEPDEDMEFDVEDDEEEMIDDF